MRLIIEARLEGSETGTPGSEARVVAVIERQDHSVADLGLTLVEGRALLAKVQAGCISAAAQGAARQHVSGPI